MADRTNIEAAENMLVGSLFAGIAFSWARLGDVHAMSHPVSAFFNVPHGVANAILLPTIVDYIALADTGKYLKIYNYIAKCPLTEAEFDAMAEDAMKSGNIAVNPRSTTKKDVRMLYQKAL